MSAGTGDGPDAAHPPVEAEGLHEGLAWSGGILEDADAEGGRFVDCGLSSLVLAGGSFKRTSWRGGRWSAVRLLGVGLARSQWLDVDLQGCALSGAELFGAQLRRVRFTGGLLDTVNLRGAVLTDVVFEDCALRDVDLGGARLTRVRLPGCRTERLDLTKAVLMDVDLRRAEIGIARGFDRLGGAVVDTGQLLDLAPALAAHLGIDVRAPGDD